VKFTSNTDFALHNPITGVTVKASTEAEEGRGVLLSSEDYLVTFSFGHGKNILNNHLF